METFVLVGPHAGKTGAYGGRVFVDGRCTVYGLSDDDVARVGRTLAAYYSAFPAHEAEERQKAYDEARAIAKQAIADLATPSLVTVGGTAPGAPESTQEASEPAESIDTSPDTPEAAEDDLDEPPTVTKEPEEPTVTKELEEPEETVAPTLAEAIATLDPENAEHWTSNNLPSLAYLGALTGKAIVRAKVEQLAPGYTRAQARKLKSGN